MEKEALSDSCTLWNDGMLEYWVSKAERVLFLVQDHFAEARGRGFLAFSLKSAAGGRSSNLFQGNVAKSEFFRGLKGKGGGGR